MLKRQVATQYLSQFFHLIIKTIKRIKFLSWKPILLFNFANPNNYKEENEKNEIGSNICWVSIGVYF